MEHPRAKAFTPGAAMFDGGTVLTGSPRLCSWLGRKRDDGTWICRV